MSMRERDEFEIQQVKDIGAFFKQLRNKRNKTQREEAAVLGCSQATLTRFELGSDEYRLSMLQKFAEHYGYRLEIAVVPIDSEIDTRIVAKPDPSYVAPKAVIRTSKKARKRVDAIDNDPVYETNDEFNVEEEMAALRARLAS